MVLFMASIYFSRTKPIILTTEAIIPDLLLLNSKLYIQEEFYTRSYVNLERAIKKIKRIKSQADPDSQVHIERALIDLEKVNKDMRFGNFSSEDLKASCILALNALTYAQIKLAEEYVLSNEVQKARRSLINGMLHVKNALVFSEGSKKENEINIYIEMNSIVQDDQLTDKTIIAKLEEMLHELEDLEITFH